MQKKPAAKANRVFFPRPCDDGRKPDWAWCVEEVEFCSDGSAKWHSTLYEPVMIRLGKGDNSIELPSMTKSQAKLEAVLWQRERDSSGKGLPKKRGWRGSK